MMVFYVYIRRLMRFRIHSFKDWFSDFNFHWMMWNEVTECIGVQVSQLIESVGFSMYNLVF